MIIDKVQAELSIRSLFSVALFAMLGSITFAQETTPTNISGSVQNYEDPSSLFKIQYPGKLLHAEGKPGVFVSKDVKTFVVVGTFQNNDGRTWKQEYQDTLSLFAKDKITYQVLKPGFFVLSGYRGSKIFYRKEIPLRRNGLASVVVFNMIFPKEEKETWNYTLKVLTASLKTLPDGAGQDSGIGWTGEPSQAEKTEWFQKAQDWVAANVQCIQYPPTNNWKDAKLLPQAPGTVDPFYDAFFNISSGPATQFLLSVHGPCPDEGYRGYHACDQKFVLFTQSATGFSGQVLSEEDEKGFYNALRGSFEIIHFSDGKQGLVLSSADSFDTTGFLFKEVHGNIRKVLEFESDHVPYGIMDERSSSGILIPEKNGNLKVLTRTAIKEQAEESDGEGTISYSETEYSFDPTLARYQPLKLDKPVPNAEGDAEWAALNRDMIESY